MRLRIAWGGKDAVAWQGIIEVSEGEFQQPRSLGNEADTVAAVRVSDSTIRIADPRPRSYEAVEVTVNAPLSASLRIEFTGQTVREGPRIPHAPAKSVGRGRL